MTRNPFGGTSDDQVFRQVGSFLAPAPGVTVTFWTTQTGGTQHTSLQDSSFAPITAVTSDAKGYLPLFYGPDGVSSMWADSGDATRRLMYTQGMTGPAGPAGGTDSATAGFITSGTATPAALASAINDNTSPIRAALTRNGKKPVGRDELVFNVRDYGAVGDGTADDTGSVSNTASTAGVGGRLLFPPGTYKVTGLNMTVQQTWTLAPGAVITLASGATLHAVQISASGGVLEGGKVSAGTSAFSGVFIANNLSDVTVRDVEVAGGTYGVRVKGGTGPVTSRVSVLNCVIHDQVSHGVFFNWECVDSEVVGNQIYNTGANGIWIGNGSVRAKVTGNTITSSSRIGIEMNSGSPGALVSGNVINGAATMGISIDSSDGSKVTKNHILNVTTSYGIELARSNRCVISDNHVEGTGTHGIAQTCASTGTTDDNYIAGNTVINAGNFGICAVGSGGGSKRCRVIGNTVINPVSSAIAQDVGIGCQDWTVSGNHIYLTTTATSGVVSNAPGMNIIGNQINYLSTIATAGGTAISLASSALDNVVSGNVVLGNAKVNKGITVASACTGVLVSGNRISGTQQDVINNASASPTNVISSNVGTASAGGGFTLGSAVGSGNKMTSTGYAVNMGPHRFEGNIGFYGTTPIAKQTVLAAATDAATTQALVNDLRAKLIALGLVS